MKTEPDMAVTRAHVTHEINQIARNFECLGEDAAASATVDHIELFWPPLLKEVLAGHARGHPAAFSRIAGKAIALLP
jgi:hypothetical protein